MNQEKKILEFSKLNDKQKMDLYKKYFKSTGTTILVSSIFIILSSSKPIVSFKNGAIYVLAGYILAILLDIIAYRSQCDYNEQKKKAEKYAKRHKNENVEKGYTFSPKAGGDAFLAIQLALGLIFCVPMLLIYEFCDSEIYEDVYMKLLTGIYADTYIVTFCTITLRLLGYECTNGRTLKTIPFREKLKFGAATIICVIAFIYYVINEFEGLFDSKKRIIVGLLYILFILWQCLWEPLKGALRKYN